MLLIKFAELGSKGELEMSWFHGLPPVQDWVLTPAPVLSFAAASLVEWARPSQHECH